MAAKPTIQLRTIFLVFVCAAVGLTCATALPKNADLRFVWFHTIPPRENLFHFLLYTGAALIVAGLIAQIRDLARLQPMAAKRKIELRFALLFAISWRAAIVVAFCACAVGQILLAREKIKLPETE